MSLGFTGRPMRIGGFPSESTILHRPMLFLLQISRNGCSTPEWVAASGQTARFSA